MLLSKPAIEREMAAGNIVIDPFVPENLSGAQYDVTLGEYFWAEDGQPCDYTFNPYDEESVRSRWKLHKAMTHEEHMQRRKSWGDTRAAFKNIGLDERIIILGPGQNILAHTVEFIGSPCDFIRPDMSARSSTGRNLVTVCKCAGKGDPGYFNRWTMEITNISPYSSVTLPVGRRIAQIEFHRVEPVGEAALYGRTGKYQGTTSIEELRASWTPEHMLPKQWLDRECRAVRQ